MTATFSKFRDGLRLKFQRFDEVCEKLNRSQILYVAGGLFGILALFWHLTPFNDIFITSLFMAGMFFSFALISDLLVIYQKVWDTTIGKGLLLLVYAAATNITYATAARVVNELVKFDTSSLTYTVNFVAVLIAPLFIFFATCAALAVVLALGQFYLMFTLYSKDLQKSKFFSRLISKPFEEYPGLTFIARVLVFPSLLGMLWSFSNHITPGYEKFIGETAGAFIFNFDALRYSRCETDSASRVIKVTDTEIVVVKHAGGTYEFSPQTCKPKVNP